MPTTMPQAASERGSTMISITLPFPPRRSASILTSELDNKAYSTSYSEYDSETTYDKVFLLSWSEIQNTAYGFSSNSARQAKGTDYAKCQGLYVNSSNECSYWRLRSAGDYSVGVCRVDSGGDLNNNYWDVHDAFSGVRPAIKISNLASGIFESKLEKLSKSEYAVFVTGSDGKPLSGAKRQMEFHGKADGFRRHGGVQ